MNVVVLEGSVTRPPTPRELPSGEVVLQFDLRAPIGDAADAVPVAWSPGKRSPKLEPGDEVVVVGRVRRRFFRVGGGTQSRTEVVAEDVVPVRQRKRVAAAVAGHCGALAELRGDPAG